MKRKPAVRWVLGFLLGLQTLSSAAATQAKSAAQVWRVILRSQRLGAHGMGYNLDSMEQLSRKLQPQDIPVLMVMLKQTDLRTGSEFGLASQCEAAISPVRVAAANDELLLLTDGEDIMSLIADFSGCSPAAQQHAAQVQTELAEARQQLYERKRHEIQLKEAEDARIQRNGLKMTDPAQAAQLTRAEREEVFQRSLKAAGLDKEPRTPAQEQLVQRMYRTMVLGESANTSAKPQ